MWSSTKKQSQTDKTQAHKKKINCSPLWQCVHHMDKKKMLQVNKTQADWKTHLPTHLVVWFAKANHMSDVGEWANNIYFILTILFNDANISGDSGYSISFSLMTCVSPGNVCVCTTWNIFVFAAHFFILRMCCQICDCVSHRVCLHVFYEVRVLPGPTNM